MPGENPNGLPIQDENVFMFIVKNRWKEKV
jgi:hypothetical protein